MKVLRLIKMVNTIIAPITITAPMIAVHLQNINIKVTIFIKPILMVIGLSCFM